MRSSDRFTSTQAKHGCAPQECINNKGETSVQNVGSSKRILRAIKVLRILKIIRLLKGIKLIE
jgi:hypothetical protein